MPERPMVWPILILVSLTPSVSDQPEGHFDRSSEKPSGPVSVLPSAEGPHLLSLIRCTTASRCFAHSASQSFIEAGRGTAVAAVLLVAALFAGVLLVAPPAV